MSLVISNMSLQCVICHFQHVTYCVQHVTISNMPLVISNISDNVLSSLQMYPSIQAKIWGNIGMVSDLFDMVLDSFIKVSDRPCVWSLYMSGF